LQNQVFYRVGGTRPIRSNVRVVVATNTDLKRLAEEGRFRSDLMFRLNVIDLHLPPLRERRKDIPLLLDYFLGQFAKEINKPVQGISDEALAYLSRYSWPGNIRELANCLERAILLSDRPVLDIADFAPSIESGRTLDRGRAVSTDADTLSAEFAPHGGRLSDVERVHILAALERNDWNQLRTAKELGIHRNTLRKKIQEYDLKRRG